MKKQEECTDIDECVVRDNACPAQTRCENTPGSYDCICESGLQMKQGIRISDPVFKI